ncbi:hypothetical protein CASFOL_013685 [Castilleja foliolosa]|uniref:Embryogenesis-associated protein EMB8 n=1 Tax=Castilleja foliolosa TaxID=1961234 RepID=A0ABD3DKP2_9LAMI
MHCIISIGSRSSTSFPTINTHRHTHRHSTSAVNDFRRRHHHATKMSLTFGHPEFLLPASSPHRMTIPSRQYYRARKRRRLKPLTVHNQLNPTPSPFDNIIHSLIFNFPSANSLNYIALTLGLASGLGLFLSSSSPKWLPKPKTTRKLGPDIGEWILFTSPTPFNRFIILRCPSIYFPGNELPENVNERLVKEERHYVELNCGRMIQPVKSDGDENMVYQRICVGAEDGGVLSLDWPANLDFDEARGLDTTMLIVPGTEEGSNEWKIRVFVCECLKRGIFPVVMNPRGCAGSPLTTARLFTAADSDDVSTAVRYINKKRPWTTLMGVGWGYGANMLTKYLAEFGERTPLMAATCIDNPFDLEEAMRSTVYHTDFDQRHTNGLIKILQFNKEIFQGQGKGFDVEKALSASSTREFDRAISMVCHGFDTIEDFYEKSSTRDVVGRVKVPVLFIQNDDGRVPLFSIPRGAIAENPYTSLLLCAYSPSSKIMDDALTFSWWQHLTLEWLTAVELGFLKGRHPLLKDIDVTINPSKGLEMLESRTSNKRARVDMLPDLSNGDDSTNPPLKMFNANDTAMTNQSKPIKDIGASDFSSKGLQQEDNDFGRQSGDTVDSLAEEGTNERRQVLQTAQVVINMLDMTMPGTLSEEQKKKVLGAVDQGETLIKALEDAVPEDVRGKLTTAVSGILQDRGSYLKLDKLKSLGKIPDLVSGLNSKVRPKKTNDDENVHSLDQKKTIDDPGDGSAKADHSSDRPPGGMELEKQSSSNSQKPSDTDMDQPTSNLDRNVPDLEKMNTNDVGISSSSEEIPGVSTTHISDREIVTERNANQETSSMVELEKQSLENSQKPNDTDMDQPTSNLDRNDSDSEKMNMNGVGISSSEEELPGGSTTLSSDRENVPERNANQETPSMVDGSGGADEIIANQKKVERENHKGESDLMEENNKQTNDLSNDQNNQNGTSEAYHTEDKSSAPSPTSDTRVIESEAENNQKKEEKFPMSNSSHDTSDSPQLGVSQALDALTGFDDSTQVAVNSVFHVIEGMIDKLEVEKHNENKVNNENNESQVNGVNEVKEQHCEHGEQNSSSSDTKNTKSQLGAENEISLVPAPGQLPAGNSLKCLSSSSENVLNNISIISSKNPLYKEYLKTYLYLKTRNAKPPDMDKLAALYYLDYIPEEGQLELLKWTAENSASVDEYAINASGFSEDQTKTRLRSKDTDSFVEPSYVILDSDKSQDQIEESKDMVIVNNDTELGDTKFKDSKLFIKNIILECLNIEVGRRASAADIEELELKLAGEIEFVANAVSMDAGRAKLYMRKGNDDQSEKLGSLDGENIIKAISSAFQDTQYLRRVLPVGVAVGASLAALRKFFNVATLGGNDEKHQTLDQVDKSTKSLVQAAEKSKGERLIGKNESNNDFTSSTGEEEDIIDLEALENNQVMVGAVTAALGASAILARQPNTGTDRTLNELPKEKENSKEPTKLDEMQDNTQNNIVTSLAEKAMSVASPVVPMKEDGELDHERLVSMLTELGQKGGMLKLVGKVALLWGGMRGAMSLTDKLISFLRISERPLFQRIICFVFLVLLLWSPIVLPFIPTFMQSWATHRPFKIAEFACIAGLYVSTLIMVTLWGKRIRQYDDPQLQYGLDLASIQKFQNFLKGLVGGATIVVLIHSVNSSLGCAHLSWSTTLSSSSSDPVAFITSYGWMFRLIIQGVASAMGVSLVEELLFRSWLPQEIAADFGYHQGIVISGLIFALSQRSTWEIPGLWLLSLALSGARHRSSGSLSLPIGLRTGMLASNSILKRGNFLTYQPNLPLWVTGGHPFQPFSGVVGLAFSLALAVILYPRQPLHKKKATRVIRE